MPPIASHDARALARVLMLVTGAIASCSTFSDAVDPGTGSVFEHTGGTSGAGNGGSIDKGGGGGSGGNTGGSGGSTGGSGGATGGAGGTGGANKGGMAGSSGGQAGSATGGAAGSAGATGTGGAAGAAGAPPGSPVDACMKAVNAHRVASGLPEYTRWASGEACGDEQAEAVAKGQAKPDLAKCGAWAGTICPDWPGPPETMVTKCIDQIWSGGGQPHDFLASTTYTQIACGFYESPQSKVWATQMFR